MQDLSDHEKIRTMTDRNKERELHAKGAENIFSAITAEISLNPGKEEKRHVEHQTGRTRKRLPVL